VIEVETPAGRYSLEAEWFVDATGANSRIRDELGLPAHASRHTDRWCISDVRFKKPFAVERWTWIDAPFNEGRGVWQHLMADAVWRLDYQMDEHADPESISRPEVAGARLREQLGPDVEFEFVWIGPYQYRDHLLDTFRVGRTIFIGDAAHSSARSARAAATTASRTRPTSAGSSPSSCAARRASRSSTAISTSAMPRRSRTCASPAAPRASSRRAAPPSTACDAPSSTSRGGTSSHAGSPTPAGWRKPTPTPPRRGARQARAQRAETSPSTARR
jgi:hypothetical protein